MRPWSVSLLVAVMLMFVLIGCSDNATPPLAPADGSANAPPLQKPDEVSTPASFNGQKTLTGEGEMWTAGGKLQMKRFGVWEPVQSAETRVAGPMLHYLSLTVDLQTGEGPCHGTFTIYPTGAGGGVWEGTYQGYRSRTADPAIFTLPLNAVGHGKGGTIDGMKLTLSVVLTVFTGPPHAPPMVPYHWTGSGVGIVKEH